MMQAPESHGLSKTTQYIVTAAALVVVIAGMRAAASLLVPFLLALFIAILCIPAIQALKKRKIPEALAITFVIMAVIVIGIAVAALIGSSLDDFSRNLPMYEDRITAMWTRLLVYLDKLGISLPEKTLVSHFDPRSAVQMVRVILTGFGNAMANSFLIIVMVILILLESGSFAHKIRMYRTVHDTDDGHADFVSAFSEKVRMYMGIKTWMSLLTGVLVALTLWLLGVDYPQLWGVLAFLLNFVPNIGSIIAAVPAVLIALVQAGSMTAVLAAGAYAVINIVIGNVIEPKLMGKGLGLSTLVVFVSLVFWGWVLGPVGMLLSVPLTVTVKLALDSKDETRWAGALLGHVD